jgi:hypothetical protein
MDQKNQKKRLVNTPSTFEPAKKKKKIPSLINKLNNLRNYAQSKSYFDDQVGVIQTNVESYGTEKNSRRYALTLWRDNKEKELIHYNIEPIGFNEDPSNGCFYARDYHVCYNVITDGPMQVSMHRISIWNATRKPDEPNSHFIFKSNDNFVATLDIKLDY